MLVHIIRLGNLWSVNCYDKASLLSFTLRQSPVLRIPIALIVRNSVTENVWGIVIFPT